MKLFKKQVISLLLVVVMLLSMIPTTAFAAEENEEIDRNVAQWDNDGDGILEILAIGNSFSVDALQYAYQIAKSLGIEEIVIGNLYIGGCSLATHADNADGDLGKYTYYYNSDGKWSSTSGYKISTALESRSWDFVSLQQASNYSGVESTYNEDLDTLISYVKERSEAKLVWHMTWAYQQNSTHSAFPTYGKDQITMYNAIVSAVQNKIVTNDSFDLLVPNGTAVQNSRTSLLGDTTTRDGYHMSDPYGRYLTGLMAMKCITGLDVSNIDYAPSGITDVQKQIAIESVNNAYQVPYAVTESIYQDESLIPEGFILQNLDLTALGYWNSSNKNGRHNQIITGASNSNKFYCTAQFTKEHLPVGSVLVLENGWQYRPDGWITDAVNSNRPTTTTETYVVISEDWWADYTLRAFNISKVDLTSLKSVTEAEISEAFKIYVPASAHIHTFVHGICAECGSIMENCIWQIVEKGKVVGAFADLQDAVDVCEENGAIQLTENCAVTTGATIEKNITIDGGNHLVDISGCTNAFVSVGEGVEATIRNLALDGGADGFDVDYDAVTYTNYTIPLVTDSLDNNPKASQSAIISRGNLICENVDIANRYTASVGGGIQILKGNATLIDCDFTHNYGASKGGALYIGSNFGTRTEYPVEMVAIENCTFTKNYTGHGGAIYAYNMDKMTITNSVFDSNTANGGKGGAIDLFSETTTPSTAIDLGLGFMQTTIKGCSFENNWAGNDGFAIQTYDSDLYVSDSEFIGNVGVHPTSSVGTVSIEHYRGEDWRIYTSLDDCLFEGNRGPAAVYGDHSSPSDLDVTNCVFRNNEGNSSFLLYSATTNMDNCQFIGEKMVNTVIDARIYENYEIPPLLTMTDVSFTDCDTPTEILTRKQKHNMELNTYNVILQGTTNGDITIWDNNAVSILGNHIGNVQLDYDSQRDSLKIGDDATIKGIIFSQPESVNTAIGKKFRISVQAEGEGLTYQWYYKDTGMKKFGVSSNKTSAYSYTMQSYMHNRQVYCVITDKNGNQVTTNVATITRPPMELKILSQPKNVVAAKGEKFKISPEVQGDGLTYQWYYKDSGMKNFGVSSNKTSAYGYTMQNYMNKRQVYCVITDQYENQVTTDIVTISLPPVELKILTQPTDVYAVKGEKFKISPEVQGDGLKYQWYYKESYGKKFAVSSNKTFAYSYNMQSYMNGRQVYCVVTDQYGNQVTTETVTIHLNK